MGNNKITEHKGSGLKGKVQHMLNFNIISFIYFIFSVCI
jgi:hypothetical protein